MSGGKIIDSGERIIRSSKIAPCDDGATREALAAFLRRAVPLDTAKVVGRGTRTSPATVYKWLNKEAFPGGLALIRLWRMFGMMLIIEVFGEHPERLADLLERANKRRAALAQIAALDRLSG